MGILLIASVFYSRGPIIQWTPEKIKGEIFIGTAKVFSAQFVSKKDLENIQLWITPELADFLAVVPDHFDEISKNEAKQIEIIASIPLDTSIGSYDGPIHLKALKQKGKEGVSKTFAKPLPMTLIIKEPTVEEIPVDEVSLPTIERIYEDEETGTVYVRDEIIIGFEEGTSEARIKEIVAGVNGIFLGSIPDLDAYQIQILDITDPSQLEQIIQELEAYPEVIIATYHWLDG